VFDDYSFEELSAAKAAVVNGAATASALAATSGLCCLCFFYLSFQCRLSLAIAIKQVLKTAEIFTETVTEHCNEMS